MNAKIIVSAVAAVAVASGVPSGAMAQNQKQSFQDFRNEIMGNYKEFRQTLLDNYAAFLNGEWREYESLNGEKRYKKPKLDKAPTVAAPKGQEKPERPVPLEPQPPVTPKEETPVIPKEETPVAPVAPSAPVAEEPGIVEFAFYGLPVSVPEVAYTILPQLGNTSDYARQWKSLADANVASQVVPALSGKAEEMGLNDYLTFQLVKAYIEGLFPDKDDTARFSAMHYLLANMGYDVRIAATADGIPLMLIPFDRMVYGRTYMMLDGKKYYVFAPDKFDIAQLGQKRIYTCKLPDNVDKGKDFGLVVGELKIPYKPYRFELHGADITLSGEMNENLIPILYRYPQMGVDGFASSVIEPALRESLTAQLRSQLGGSDADAAVDKLLGFTQNAFEYATDEDNHGFEKPYFLEETLYYPKNDCEDRAIFYTYFLWNALDREAQLVSFPGHEAATVEMASPVKGTAYQYGGKTYYISDPTYIGATTGMVMPMYRGESPTVDYTYK